MAENYLAGFGNYHLTEAVAGALPQNLNSPQRSPLGLYAEKFNAAAFTAPRAANRRTWFYRILPSVKHGAFRPIDRGLLRTSPDADGEVPAAQLRWNPLPVGDGAGDFVDGLYTYATNGDAHVQAGIGVHYFAARQSMERRYFMDADGELLIVPQLGSLTLRTECGRLDVEPGEIAIVPRGFKFAVDLQGAEALGYICENYGAMLTLPELGPIGTDGLANPRHFAYPVAAYEDGEEPCELVMKLDGKLFACELERSPLDVVAWHGNCAPCKYDLRKFNTIGSISVDHPDPSIFTVLTSQSDTAGTANVDFVIFPPRWLVQEDTFRPPWYHRNIMSEFMGLIYGQYDAKPEGFVPGGASLHNCMLPHGPDVDAFEGASNMELVPQKLDNTMAFMFESRYPFRVTQAALDNGLLQDDYPECWADLKVHFSG